MPESKEVIKIRNSRKVYFPVYLMIFILVLTITIIKISDKELNNLAFKGGLIFSLIILIFTEIHRFSNLYEINQNSLVHTKGIFVKKTKRVDLLSISDADSKQNPWQRLFKYGDVNINLFSGYNAVPVKTINHPKKFVDFLEEKTRKKRIEEGVGGIKG